MTHQPKQILVQVKCSERMPETSGDYLTNIRETYFSKEYNEFINDYAAKLNPEYWYEPQTAIVLSEEEYLVMQEKLRIADEMVLEINKLKSLNPNP